MTSARKRLRAMRDAANPCNFTYADAAQVLKALGFVERRGSGSHRHWRLDPAASNLPEAITVGLVESGHGTVKAVYIKNLIQSLAKAGLLDRLERTDADMEP